MKRLLFLFLLAATYRYVAAQQLVCERTYGAIARILPYNAAALAPDSVVMLAHWNTNAALPQRQRLFHLQAGCDTVPFAPLPPVRSGGCSNLLVRRGGLVWASNEAGNRWGSPLSSPDSARIRIQMVSRTGALRWQRTLPPVAGMESGLSLLAAPDGGFLLAGLLIPSNTNLLVRRSFLAKLDSAGRLQWRRIYGTTYGHIGLRYTPRGTLLLLTQPLYPVPYPFRVLELSQRGDSLSSHPLLAHPNYTAGADDLMAVNFGAQPLTVLRGGGYLLTGHSDSLLAGGGSVSYPFLMRLDAQGNRVWAYIRRGVASSSYVHFGTPLELADGTCVVTFNNGPLTRNTPYYLLRFSATGTLLQQYSFTPQATLASFGTIITNLLPLAADSSLVLTSDANYVARLRVPGLPRVVTGNDWVPAAALATRGPQGVGATLAVFPNPAGPGPVTVRAAGPPGRTLRLLDRLGRTVQRAALPPSGETQLPTAGLPGGLYLLQLRDAAGRLLATQKLVVP